MSRAFGAWPRPARVNTNGVGALGVTDTGKNGDETEPRRATR